MPGNYVVPNVQGFYDLVTLDSQSYTWIIVNTYLHANTHEHRHINTDTHTQTHTHIYIQANKRTPTDFTQTFGLCFVSNLDSGD